MNAATTDHNLLLGLDIGGTKCAAIVGDAKGAIHDRIEWASDAQRGPDAMIAELIDHGRAIIERNGTVHAAGVSIGGPLDMTRGVVLSPPNLPGWDAVPLRDRLTEAFDLPVRVMHDAAACAGAEHAWGGHDLPDDATLVYLTCGTGFGAGLVIRGRVHIGADGASPEFGHVRLTDDPTAPAAFGVTGSAEALCSARGLSRIAAWRFTERWPDPPPPERITQLADQHDADALAVIDLHAMYMGKACAMLIDLLRPNRIVLGSLARRLPDRWLRGVQKQVRRDALPAAAAACRIAPAALGERLQDLSAIAAALAAPQAPVGRPGSPTGTPNA